MEQVTVLLEPPANALESLADGDFGLPSSVAGEFAVIGDVNELVAGAEAVAFELETASGEFLDLVHQLNERHGVAGPATYVVNLAARLFPILVCGLKGAHEIGNAQNVAHL